MHFINARNVIVGCSAGTAPEKRSAGRRSACISRGDTRANIHYLCTEYGCVNLKGLTSWEKAEALISVAHPDFREQLIAEADKMHIWRRSNKR